MPRPFTAVTTPRSEVATATSVAAVGVSWAAETFVDRVSTALERRLISAANSRPGLIGLQRGELLLDRRDVLLQPGQRTLLELGVLQTLHGLLGGRRRPRDQRLGGAAARGRAAGAVPAAAAAGEDRGHQDERGEAAG